MKTIFNGRWAWKSKSTSKDSYSYLRIYHNEDTDKYVLVITELLEESDDDMNSHSEDLFRDICNHFNLNGSQAIWIEHCRKGTAEGFEDELFEYHHFEFFLGTIDFRLSIEWGVEQVAREEVFDLIGEPVDFEIPKLNRVFVSNKRVNKLVGNYLDT